MKIIVKKTFRDLEEGWEYDFTMLNELNFITIVGENGCGKSSILQALRGTIKEEKNDSLYKTDYIVLSDNIKVEHGYEKVIFFDGVKDNGSDMMNAFDAMSFLNMGGYAAQRLSHGQGTLMYIAKFVKENKDSFIPNKTLLVFDEIDNGLSLANQVKIIQFIINMTRTLKVHVLIVTHNPFLIQQSFIVYSFSERKFIPSNEYIEKLTGYSLTPKDKA